MTQKYESTDSRMTILFDVTHSRIVVTDLEMLSILNSNRYSNETTVN